MQNKKDYLFISTLILFFIGVLIVDYHSPLCGKPTVPYLPEIILFFIGGILFINFREYISEKLYHHNKKIKVDLLSKIFWWTGLIIILIGLILLVLHFLNIPIPHDCIGGRR